MSAEVEMYQAYGEYCCLKSIIQTLRIILLLKDGLLAKHFRTPNVLLTPLEVIENLYMLETKVFIAIPVTLTDWGEELQDYVLTLV